MDQICNAEELLPMREHATQLREKHSGPPPAMAQLLGEGHRYRSGLTWFDAGVGWYNVTTGIAPYDRAYFEKYRGYGRTEMGRKLNAARVDFVARHYPQGLLCDVGIGSGSFIEARPQVTFGFDVNPIGVQWLRERGLFADPYRVIRFPALTLWDVLEHIEDFSPLLARCGEWLFLSLPLFRDCAHAEQSKHFRPDEHYWYFTANSLMFVLDRLGFDLVAQNDMETQLGREDIGTFAFRRRL
jgi:hypothetical protein